MAAFTKYNTFVDEMSKGGHNLQADSFKVALTNTAPPAPGTTDTIWSAAIYPPPAAANNYTSGGNALTISSATTAAYVFKMIINDSVFTATAGGIGPFRYSIVYNTSKSNKVVGYYDYGSSITLADTETFTVDFDPTNGMIQMTMTP